MRIPEHMDGSYKRVWKEGALEVIRTLREKMDVRGPVTEQTLDDLEKALNGGDA